MMLSSLLFLVGLPQAPLRVGSVEIHTKLSRDMFPDSWRGADIAARATPIEALEVARSVRLIKKALAKYPAELLKTDLKRIYLVKELFFYGLPYGGTNSLDALYLCNEGVAKGFSDSYIEGSVYHEFSSILLRNYSDRWKESAWKAANPKGFRYLGNGTDAVREGAASLIHDPKLYRLGFLTIYSKASVEEDFNVMSEALFMRSTTFLKAVNTHAALRAKYRVAVEFYRAIDPVLPPK